MTVLVTGAAGFIGHHVVKALLARGDEVIGVDNLNDYYEVSLKEARLAQLAPHQKTGQFTFHRLDMADHEALSAALKSSSGNIGQIVHLAAQAGVRYSLTHPFAYAQSNLNGHLSVLELARGLPNLKHCVYASSSSVYGNSAKLPLSLAADIRHPVSLYAATKGAGELMSHSYSHLYHIPLTGLRYFTVYGPWGRPDMAYFIFARGITEGTPIKIFGHGNMRRDFTYIDDIVAGTLAALEKPPTPENGQAPHRLFNLGNDRSELLLDLIALLEKELGKKAIAQSEPMQEGDVRDTHADISESRRILGYAPKTTLMEGIPRFLAWFRQYYQIT